jgi:hypothetical protein
VLGGLGKPTARRAALGAAADELCEPPRKAAQEAKVLVQQIGGELAPRPDLDGNFGHAEVAHGAETLVAVGHKLVGAQPHHRDGREASSSLHRVPELGDPVGAVRDVEQVDDLHDRNRSG